MRAICLYIHTSTAIVVYLWHFLFVTNADQSVTHSDGDIRLVGGSGPHEGIVEIFYQGMWGRTCTRALHLHSYGILDTTSTSTTVCRRLGYSKALPVKFEAYQQWCYRTRYGTGTHLIWHNVSCNALEVCLRPCSNKYGLGVLYWHYCYWFSYGTERNSQLAVTCSSELIIQTDIYSASCNAYTMVM